MILRPFFTYFGGKWRLAPRYPAPRYQTLIEPFAGSAGYALRHPERDVWLNDLDPVIAGLWQYLTRVTPAEILALPDEPNDSLPQEAVWLIRWWWAKGRAEMATQPSSWNRSGSYSHHTNFWGQLVKERIAAQIPAIRHWRVTNLHYTSMPDEEATWFIDPPYVRAGSRYRTCDVDYADLAEWCKARRGQAIVCEGDGADWLPFEPFHVTKTMYGERRRRASPEVVWIQESSSLVAA